ncbi:acyl-CoA dehydrogenase family protein [Microbulbifer pacificus]|uniref:acyl-CoA dehydrogenase family protein n=1 Tax=Microbulbifer pacificus TaxID=407164 RepID=UPI000CF52A2F|nr:acyl-CoA dehydrogenase family protein [Microbulbifer pacificus]
MNLTHEEQAFREEVRNFLEENFPKDIQQKARNHIPLSKDDHVRWQKILFEKGWAAENWPLEYGGTGWTHVQKHIFAEECAQAYAPEVIAFGMRMVAPVIFTFGNEEQKKRFLPDILASNVWWCQGYSEPNAGSDLASLKTTATRDGDDYIVNGTKSWTTLGHWADWIFCLVKTGGPDTKAQESISFLLIDMQTPGVTVSPIITLDGRREVNEVHFDNVRVPVVNRIGDEGKGWTYAKELLTHERTGIARVAHSKVRLRDLKKLARSTPSGDGTLAEDPIFRHKVADIELDLLALEYTELRTLAAVSTGKAPGPESSILKIKGSGIGQLIDELYLEVAGHHALPFVPEQFDMAFCGDFVGPWYAADTAPHYFNYRKTTIYGGSNEIQKNIISKFVLGL